MGRIYRQKGSPFWSLDYTDTAGVRQRVSAKTTSKREARELLSLREAEVFKGEVVAPRADRTTYEVVRDNLLSYYRTTKKWKNLDEAQRRISYLDRTPVAGFQSGFGGRLVTTITSAAVRGYCEFRLSECVPHSCTPRAGSETCDKCRRVAPATVNRELAFLRRMLRLGQSEGLVMKVPRIEMLREAAPRKGFVDEAQYALLSRHLRADLKVVLAIGYRLGWRVKSEVLTLEKRNVDLAAGCLRLDVGSTKNGEGRVGYLTPELARLVKEQLGRVHEIEKELKRVVPHVFPYLDGSRAGKRVQSFRKEWRRATTAAGLPGLLVHDLRRSAVRNLERAGVPRSHAMALTGHKTESVYRRYAIVSDADLKEVARRLHSLEG